MPNPEFAAQNVVTRSDRWHAITASFLGWTLDAFDFFVLTFLIDVLAAQFHVSPKKIIFTTFTTLAMRPVGALLFGLLAVRFAC
jgi:MFS transporter, SHS family, lactate transporter